MNQLAVWKRHAVWLKRPGKDVFMSCGGGGAKAAKEAELKLFRGVSRSGGMLPRKPPEKVVRILHSGHSKKKIRWSPYLKMSGGTSISISTVLISFHDSMMNLWRTDNSQVTFMKSVYFLLSPIAANHLYNGSNLINQSVEAWWKPEFHRLK